MFENDLHDAGIEWQRVVESVSPDVSLAVSERFGMYRRWVVLVRESDYERATQIAQEGRFYICVQSTGTICRRRALLSSWLRA